MQLLGPTEKGAIRECDLSVRGHWARYHSRIGMRELHVLVWGSGYMQFIDHREVIRAGLLWCRVHVGEHYMGCGDLTLLFHFKSRWHMPINV